MPNLKTDRTSGVDRGTAALNVRRLMYQSLIWGAHLRDHARRLAAALDAKDLERAANALVDGVGGDTQLDRDLLGGEMLVDEQQAVELPLAQSRHPGLQRLVLASLGRHVHPDPLVAAVVIDFDQHNWLFTAKAPNRQSDGIAFVLLLGLGAGGGSPAPLGLLVIAMLGNPPDNLRLAMVERA